MTLDLPTRMCATSDEIAPGPVVVVTAVEVEDFDVRKRRPRSAIDSRVGSNRMLSCQLSPSVAHPTGMPLPSVAKDHFHPDLTRSQGSFPVPSPPQDASGGPGRPEDHQCRQRRARHPHPDPPHLHDSLRGWLGASRLPGVSRVGLAESYRHHRQAPRGLRARVPEA